MVGLVCEFLFGFVTCYICSFVCLKMLGQDTGGRRVCAFVGCEMRESAGIGD
jgi:hypothetical protein